MRYSFIDAVKEYSTSAVQSSNTMENDNNNNNNNNNNMFASLANLLTPKSISVKKKSKTIKSIIDVGCSVGVSTFYIGIYLLFLLKIFIFISSV